MHTQEHAGILTILRVIEKGRGGGRIPHRKRAIQGAHLYHMT